VTAAAAAGDMRGSSARRARVDSTVMQEVRMEGLDTDNALVWCIRYTVTASA
jgi:hypothetical protein